MYWGSLWIPNAHLSTVIRLYQSYRSTSRLFDIANVLLYDLKGILFDLFFTVEKADFLQTTEFGYLTI